MNLAKLPVWIIVVIQILHFGAGTSHGDKRCSCYTFEIYDKDSPMSWVQAKDSCKFNSKHLVVMETQREWEFINKEIQNRISGKDNECFIGLFRNLTTGKWTWVNGKALTIDQWQKNKPFNDDFFALMAKEFPPGFKGSFNSLRGNVKRAWICEEETDNCQGVCLHHNPVQTTTASPVTTATTISSGTSPRDKPCSCYTFENDKLMSWPQAMASCKLINKDLVVIETEREWEFITMKIQTRKGGKYNEWYIGLYKSLITGNWTWINGKALTINKWQENTTSNNNSYTLIAKEWPDGFKGSFKSITGNTSRGWICEEVTDNCKGVCLSHNLLQTTPTPPVTFASTTQDPTKYPEGGKQAYDKDNCSSVVIILTSLVAVLSAALLIFGVCFLSWRKKQQKDTRKAADTGNQLGDQDWSSLSPENAATQLGFADEVEPQGIELEYQNESRGIDQASRQECGYAMLTPRTMMVPGDSSYAPLVKSKQENCTNESSVAAYLLLEQDADPHDELPTYVNVHSAKYENNNN